MLIFNDAAENSNRQLCYGQAIVDLHRSFMTGNSKFKHTTRGINGNNSDQKIEI
jgi:hypothetical protein